MARRPTDYSARNARAQALGYRNYYDYRVHEYGRQPPGAPVDPVTRRALRGHAGLKDLLRVLQNARRYRIMYVAPSATERGPDGKYTHVRVDVGRRGARPLRFYLRGRAASSDNLRMLRQAIDHPGALKPKSPGGGGESYQHLREAEGQLPGSDSSGDAKDEEDVYVSDDYEWDIDAEDAYDFEFIPAPSIGELAS